MPSYKVAVRTKHDFSKWAFNVLRFFTEGEANKCASALVHRWPDVAACKVEPSDLPPNSSYPVPSDRYPVKREAEQHGDIERID